MDQAYTVATSSSPGLAAMVSAFDYLRAETGIANIRIVCLRFKKGELRDL
jgi:hypothetical protein